MESAIFIPDDSQDDGEVRWIAIGFIGTRLYVLICTELTEDPYSIRAISLRRAELSEERLYAEDH